MRLSLAANSTDLMAHGIIKAGDQLATLACCLAFNHGREYRCLRQHSEFTRVSYGYKSRIDMIKITTSSLDTGIRLGLAGYYDYTME